MGDDDKPRNSLVAKLKDLKEIVGTVVAVCGVLFAVASFLFEEAMESRDRDFEELKESFEEYRDTTAAQMGVYKERLHALESSHEETFDAARERFRQNEIVDTELQGSVSSLRSEVRIRHREDPDGYGVAMGTARLRAAGEETDRLLIRAGNARPQSQPFEGL